MWDGERCAMRFLLGIVFFVVVVSGAGTTTRHDHLVDVPTSRSPTQPGVHPTSPRAPVSPRSRVHKAAQRSFEDWYSKILDQIIAKLDEWTKRLDNPSQDDLDRIACANGFNSFYRHIGSSWALSMIDSSTKLQSGLLTGNLNDLGQYDECVKVAVTVNRSDPYTPEFTGQHCLISFNLHVPNNTIVLNGESTPLSELFGVNWIPLTVAQCYPSLCKRHVLLELFNDIILAGPDYLLDIFGITYKIDATIASTDCHVKDRGSYDVLEWTVAGIIFLFMLLSGICTSFDYFYIERVTRNRQTRIYEEFILGFSLYTNGRKLLSTNVASDAMTALNGIKFFSICWVVLGHRYRFLINQPLVNLLDFPEELKKWERMIILSGPLSVDTFFLISGLLNMYTFAIIREKSRFKPWEVLIGYIHRYLRLTPAYLVMIGLTATWVYRSGDGPYWDRVVGKARDDCRENYWENLVYLNNYLNPDNYCMMQSWYLSADMQMFWLSPLVIYPLWRWPIFGFVQIAVLAIASILAPLIVSYIYEIRAPIPLTTDPIKASHEMAYLYLPTHTKTISYVIGIISGYLLYNLKKEKIKFDPKKVTLLFFWLVSAVCMLFAVFGGYNLYRRDAEYNQIYSAFYIGFYRFFWAVGLVWIMIACITGYGGPVNAILSWAPFGPLGRLTYCVYLTHVAVMHRAVGSQRSPVFFNDFSQVEQYLGDLVISFGAAAALSLLFESPIMKIEKMLLGGGLKRQPRPRAPPPESHNHQA